MVFNLEDSGLFRNVKREICDSAVTPRRVGILKRSKDVSSAVGLIASQLKLVQSMQRAVNDFLFIMSHLQKDMRCIIEADGPRLRKTFALALDQMTYFIVERHVQEQSSLLASLDKEQEAVNLATSEIEKLKLQVGNVSSLDSEELERLDAFVSNIEHALFDDDFLSRLPAIMQQKQTKIQELNSSLADREDDVNDLLERLNNYQSDSRSRETQQQVEIDRLTLQLRMLEASLATVETEKQETISSVALQAQKASELEEELRMVASECDGYRSQIEALADLRTEVAAKELDLRGKLDLSEQTVKDAEACSARLMRELSDLQARFQAAENLNASLKSQISAAEEAICKLQGDLSASNSLKDDLTRQMLDSQRALDEARRQLVESQQRSEKESQLCHVVEKLTAKVAESTMLESALREQLDQYCQREKSHAQQLQYWSRQCDELQSLLSAEKSASEAAKGSLQMTEEKLRAAELEKSALEAALLASNSKLDQETSRICSLETVLKIELEKTRDTLQRERKVSALKIADLEERLEQVKEELLGVRSEPYSSTDTENNDPFAEARNKLAAMKTKAATESTETEIPEAKHNSFPSKAGQPPSECLQQ